MGDSTINSGDIALITKFNKAAEAYGLDASTLDFTFRRFGQYEAYGLDANTGELTSPRHGQCMEISGGTAHGAKVDCEKFNKFAQAVGLASTSIATKPYSLTGDLSQLGDFFDRVAEKAPSSRIK